MNIMSMLKRSESARQFGLKTWREFPPMNITLGTMLQNQTGSRRYLNPIYEDKTPPCQNACPAGNDIEGWIKLLQKNIFVARATFEHKEKHPEKSFLEKARRGVDYKQSCFK